jgi:hypothetical protein
VRIHPRRRLRGFRLRGPIVVIVAAGRDADHERGESHHSKTCAASHSGNLPWIAHVRSIRRLTRVHYGRAGANELTQG